jgi:His-Xaa-Ser system radical SAM maturase HxsB
MAEAMADRAIEFMLRTPAPSIKVEFQGGESLLNFELIRYIVDRVEQRNAAADDARRKEVTFVIATNLAPLTDDHLRYCLDHDVYISTSLDGPRELHNRNRPRPGRDSHELAEAGIGRVRAALGHHKVSALMTTTQASLSQPVEIVDEYVRLGFQSIFLRSISPYGFAVKTGMVDRYHVGEWLEFYKRGLAHILDLNRRGIWLREEFATIMLQKICTPWPSGYVDLQSPAGIGIGGIVFNYDGDIYASDESRMLAEMGDKTFRLGNLFSDSYEAVMRSPSLLTPLRESMAEGVPMCVDCAFLPYCGSDPVHHHATQGDAVGFKPTSDFCRKNMAVLRHLIGLLEDDEDAAAVLRSWV